MFLSNRPENWRRVVWRGKCSVHGQPTLEPADEVEMRLSGRRTQEPAEALGRESGDRHWDWRW